MTTKALLIGGLIALGASSMGCHRVIHGLAARHAVHRRHIGAAVVGAAVVGAAVHEATHHHHTVVVRQPARTTVYYDDGCH